MVEVGSVVEVEVGVEAEAETDAEAEAETEAEVKCAEVDDAAFGSIWWEGRGGLRSARSTPEKCSKAKGRRDGSGNVRI